MKKVSLAVLGGLFFVSGAMATSAAPKMGPEYIVGGFIDGNEAIVTVEQVNEMRDDIPVVLQGVIVQRMGDEKYLFQDSTGSITVEIDDDNWGGVTVSPEEVIKIYGDVDRGIFSTEIDVDYIRKM